MTNDKNSNLIQLSGLWLNKSRDGQTTYMSGYLGNAKLLIFKNQHKTQDKHPDYVAYIAPNNRPTDTDDETDQRSSDPF